MPRPSRNAVWRESDGVYTVVAEHRSGRQTYRVRAWFTGHQPDEESATTEEEAILAAECIWMAYQEGIFDNPDDAPQTLGELADMFVGREELSRKTQRSYRQVMKVMTDFMGRERSLNRVFKRDLQLWLKAMTCSNQSKKTYLRTARACCRWAVKQRFMKEDPTGDLEVRVEHVMGSWLPHHEWDAYLEACTRGHRIRSGFVLETGLRAGELAAARWPWLHGEIGRPAIRIAYDPYPNPELAFKPKWGKARAVPLSRDAQYWLEEAKKYWGDSSYIFSREGLASPNFARDSRQAVAKAKVTKVSFHGLRRSAGARWLDVGLSLHQVKELLGHRDIMTTDKWYAGVSNQHLQKAIDIVDDCVREQDNVVSFRRKEGAAD